MNLPFYSADVAKVRDRFILYCNLLGLTPEKLIRLAQLSIEEVDDIHEGNLDDVVMGKILLELKRNFGISLKRLLCGSGNFFLFRGPLITDEFYRQHRHLFPAVDLRIEIQK